MTQHTAPAKRPNIALWLTWIRIVLAPVFVLVFLYLPELAQPRTAAILALLVVVLAELTDAFDGFAARRMGTVTDLGKILDPLADSVFRLTVFLVFLKADIAPIMLVLLILYRDSLVATVRILCASHNLVLAARSSGKWKAIVQAVGILAILVLHACFPEQRPEWLAWLYLGIMSLITLVTVYSGYDYVRGTWPTLSKALGAAK